MVLIYLQKIIVSIHAFDRQTDDGRTNRQRKSRQQERDLTDRCALKLLILTKNT